MRLLHELSFALCEPCPSSGLALHPVLGRAELTLALAVLVGGLIAAGLPAVFASRASPGEALKR